MSPAKLLTSQKIVSTKEFQTRFASMVKIAEQQGTYYTVVRNGKSIGVFIPQKMWTEILGLLDKKI